MHSLTKSHIILYEGPEISSMRRVEGRRDNKLCSKNSDCVDMEKECGEFFHIFCDKGKCRCIRDSSKSRRSSTAPIECSGGRRIIDCASPAACVVIVLPPSTNLLIKTSYVINCVLHY